MDLKHRVKQIEEKAKTIGDKNPGWRMLYAKNHIRIVRMIERTFGKPQQPEKEIIAEEIRYLKYWPTEKAYLEHLEDAAPGIKHLFDYVPKNEPINEPKLIAERPEWRN